jgi:hypothetical protein
VELHEGIVVNPRFERSSPAGDAGPGVKSGRGLSRRTVALRLAAGLAFLVGAACESPPPVPPSVAANLATDSSRAAVAAIPGTGETGLPAPPAAPEPRRILFVGNSYLYYNDSLHNHLRRMVAADDPGLAGELEYKSATIGGASLLHHDVAWLTTPGRIGVEGAFEIVILQDHSAAALSPAREAQFREAVAAHDQTIRGRGGRTALYMTHAYAPGHPAYAAGDIRKIESLYTSVGVEIGAIVIPVGLAFEEALRRDPSLRLHNDEDHSHPSLAGSYLAAATLYATLYGRSPVGNAYDAFGNLDTHTLRLLQEVALTTAEAHRAR